MKFHARSIGGISFVTLSGLTAFVTSSSFIPKIDANIALYMHAMRDTRLVEYFTALTFLGSTIMVVIVTSICAFILLKRRHTSYLAGLLVSVVGASLSVFMLKGYIERARPSSALSTILESTFSFPSGHTTISIALYGFLALYLLRTLKPPFYARLLALSLLILIGLISVSRLYLGVHFLSDIIAGYALGIVWLCIAISIVHIHSRRIPINPRQI